MIVDKISICTPEMIEALRKKLEEKDALCIEKESQLQKHKQYCSDHDAERLALLAKLARKKKKIKKLRRKVFELQDRKHGHPDDY